MYNVSSLSLQNIYARPAAVKSTSKKDDSAVFSLSAGERAGSNTKTDHIIEILTAAGIFKSESEEEEEEKEKAAVDMLLAAVRANRKTLKEETVDKEKSELTDKEVKEVLAELNRHGQGAVMV